MKILVTFLILISLIFAPVANAALTQVQVDAIINLLRAFNVESSVIAEVYKALRPDVFGSVAPIIPVAEVSIEPEPTKWVNPPQEKYPQYILTLNGNKVDPKKTAHIGAGETYTIGWNVTQVDGNALECVVDFGGATTSNGSISNVGSYNFHLFCKDYILGTGNSVGLQILAR